MGAQAILAHITTLLIPLYLDTSAMPLGGKALKKREQNANAKADIVTDDLANRKQAAAKEDVKCSICSQSFKVTKKNVDQKAHAESKHPKSTKEECFPGLEFA